MRIRIGRLPALLVVLAAAFAGFSPAAYAAPITYVASLSGANEGPPNASPGTGFAEVIIDTAAHTLYVEATFADLLGNTTAAHVHAPFPPLNAFLNTGVATQTPSFSGFPLGVTSGSFSNTFDLTLASSWNAAYITNNGGTPASAEAALAAALANGQAYFNIHTHLFAGGEIRGFLQEEQVEDVPEPGTLSLIGLGVAGLAARRRRHAA